MGNQERSVMKSRFFRGLGHLPEDNTRRTYGC